MGKHAMLAAAALVTVLATACSGSYEVKAKAPISTAKYKTAYVVDSQQSAIIGYNVTPLPGSVMYLKALKIDIFDNRTNELLGSGSYTAGDGGIHDYPTSEREAPIIIDRILKGR